MVLRMQSYPCRSHCLFPKVAKQRKGGKFAIAVSEPNPVTFSPTAVAPSDAAALTIQKVVDIESNKLRAMPASQRVWKTPEKARFSALLRSKSMSSSWQKKQQIRAQRETQKEIQRRLDEHSAAARKEEKRRLEQRKKARAENERKAMVVQEVSSKTVKKMSKKQQKSLMKV